MEHFWHFALIDFPSVKYHNYQKKSWAKGDGLDLDLPEDRNSRPSTVKICHTCIELKLDRIEFPICSMYEFLRSKMWSGVGVWLALWTSVRNVKPYLLVPAAGLVYAPFTVNTISGSIPAASQQTGHTLYSWCTQCNFGPVAITDMRRLGDVV